MATATLLCTDGSGALRTAAAKLGVTSKSVAVGYDGRISEGVYHVQTVNNYHERFKTWVNRQLRGVSTKHFAQLPGLDAFVGVVQGGR
jgi:hypothetical protein